MAVFSREKWLVNAQWFFNMISFYIYIQRRRTKSEIIILNYHIKELLSALTHQFSLLNAVVIMCLSVDAVSSLGYPVS